VFILLLLSFSFAVTAQKAKITVKGNVRDRFESVVGASVVEKGTTNGTTTGISGDFTLDVAPGATLTVRYLGYASKDVQVGDRTSFEIVLDEETTALEEVVVVGFGTQKKVNLTGAISTVSSEKFENRPVSNIGQALQGVVPNLNIGIGNGAPNTVPSFNIRGGTSITSDGAVTNGSPLILVDGVDISATMLNQMNPNDIENMSVIKDASAAAIYGTKATFGVVLVTTKAGKFNRKGHVGYSFDMMWDTPSALPDILDAYTIQKSAMDKTLWTGGSVSSADRTRLDAIRKYMDNPTHENAYYMDGSTIIWVANMNPYREVVRKFTPTSRHNINLSGGSERIAYYMSLGYQGQEGMYNIGNDDYKRYNVSLRLNAKVVERLNVEAKVNYNRTSYDAPYLVGGKGTLWSAMRNETAKNINMPVMTGPDDPIPNAYTDNILGWIQYGARTSSTDHTTMLILAPEFIVVPEMLKVRADLSFTPQSGESKRRSPLHNYVTTSWSNMVAEQSEAQENRAQLARSSTDTYLINVYYDFKKTFSGKHSVASIGGFSQESVTYGSQTVNLRGLFSPDIMKPGAAEDETLHTITTGAQRRTGRAAFGSVNYDYESKYLFEVKGRYDGSSRFTKNERYFFFPSFSLGWRVSEEKFLDFTDGWLSNLKLRGSWGKLGSQPSGYYPYQATMGSGSANFILDGKMVNTVNVPGLVSPTLAWEKAATTNFGVDAGVLNNRLGVSLDVYERKTTEILTTGFLAYPTTLGATAPLENSGSLRAYGWELTLIWNDRLANGIRYSAEFVLSDSRTQVLHYASNPSKNIGSLYDGCYTGDIWGYETGGILQESDLEKNASGTGYTFYGPYHPGNLYPGYVWYRDINGDGQISAGSSTVENPGDRRIIGNSSSRYNYGLTLSASWKGVDGNIFFQGVGKRDIWTANSAYWGGGAGSRWMYDRSWTPERTGAPFPMYTAAVNAQTGYLIDGSYLRLKQASLGYTLPQSLTKKIGLEALRFNLSGYNLFEITDIPAVFDVDQISDAYPQKRTIAAGAQITF
jgi:TonB-linked SusC/RagA family outer membrane protein